MAKTAHDITDSIFKEIGEFGPYQFLVFALVGLVATIPGIVGFSFAFYAATPSFRCKIPGFANDTYEIQNENHQSLIDKFIPFLSDKSFKGIYEGCTVKTFMNSSSSNNFTINYCSEWVFSKEYFESTLVTEWNLVCQNLSQKNFFATMYFIGTYGFVLKGIISDRFGRKKATFSFIVINAVLNVLLLILMTENFMDSTIQQNLFAVLRLLTGITSNVYSWTAVLAMEIVGTSKRVSALNTTYYLFIAGEFIVLFFAYNFRDFKTFYLYCTIFISIFVLYFWLIPESPRWLMTQERFHEAYRIFKRIAKSNKKKLNECSELQGLKFMQKTIEKKEDIQLNEQMNESERVEKHLSIYGTMKLFFKSKKLLIRSISISINWLTNALVYFGISFNTSDLVGDPYLNFGLSALVEFIAVLVSHVALERFGRKIPYAINMTLTGISLISVMFVPTNFGSLVTVCALIGKFSISFTFNTIYIITAESNPTVIRNSVISACEFFSGLGAVVAPYIQLLGQLYWFPIPYIIYGVFSTISAVSFMIFIPETKSIKVPDTIEELINY